VIGVGDRMQIPAAARRGEPANRGRPLDAAVRARAELALGHDFSSVRVYAGAGAARSARAEGAVAYSIGNRLVFGDGAYAPGTPAGERLLVHELAHVVQQSPGRDAPTADSAGAEREADAAARGQRPRLSRRPVAVHRQPKTPPKSEQKSQAASGISKTELVAKLKAILGHDVTLTVGDKDRQTKELGGPKAKRKLPDTWKKWDPGTNSPLYDEIVTAFSDVGREVGGIPDITEIVFYDLHYGWDESDNVVADPNASASIQRAQMNVYSSALFPSAVLAGGSGFSSTGIPLAQERSTKKAEAGLVMPTRAESQRRTVAHELGHGIERRTGSLDEFRKAVGWSAAGGKGWKLYDIQAAGVKKAIADDKEPPAKALITRTDWDSAKHGEQPMREYAVTAPEEDFADSMMAWIYARDALKKRSPARFAYFDDATRRTGWLPKLVKPGAAPAGTPPTTTTKAKGEGS
jgi:hypothetical protein